MTQAYLAVGDALSAGLPSGASFNLNDTGSPPSCMINGENMSFGSVSLPSGIQFGAVPPNGRTKPISMCLLIGGNSQNNAQIAAITLQSFLEQAMQRSGAYGMASRIMWWYKLTSQTDWAYYDITGGQLSPIVTRTPLVAAGQTYLAWSLRLEAYPHPHGYAIADSVSSTITNGAAAAAIFRATVPGDVAALTQTVATDVSTVGVIGRFTFARRHAKGMVTTDFTPFYAVTLASPGAAFVDASAVGGTTARLTGATNAFQLIGTVTAASGAYQNGLFVARLMVRDSSAPLVPPGLPTAAATMAGGALADGVYAIQVASYDAAGAISTLTPLIYARVPVLKTGVVTFFDTFASGDASLWTASAVARTTSTDNPSLTFGGGYASYNDQDPTYGVTVDVGSTTASSAIIAKTLPSGSNSTGSHRVHSIINAITIGAGGTVGIVLSTNAAATAATTWLQAVTIPATATSATTWNFKHGASTASVTLPPIGQWFYLELRATISGGNTTVTLNVDDVQVGTLTNATPVTQFAVGGWITGGTGRSALNATFANVQMSNAALIGASTAGLVLTWPQAQAAAVAGYYLYYRDPFTLPSFYTNIGFVNLQPHATWHRTDVGNVTNYTLTALSTNYFAPPLQASNTDAFSAFQIRVGLSGDPPELALPALEMTTQYGNGVWEYLDPPPMPLPPIPQQEGQTQPAWKLWIYGRSRGPNGPTLDCCQVILLPHDPAESTLICEVPSTYTLTTKAKWQLETRYDGRASCVLYDAATGLTVLCQASTSGTLSMGPSDTKLIVVAETVGAQGLFKADVVNAKFTVQNTLRPRYLEAPGLQ